MPKLHLKRTPAEESERDWRKAKKAARKAAKKKSKSSRSRSIATESTDDGRSQSPPHKRRRQQGTNEASHGNGDEDEDEYGPPPPPSSSSHKPDYDAIRAQLEDERFREKMWGALGDDERLDSVEARLNDFAHVPNRWRDSGIGATEDAAATLDPQHMDEEDYAEWIRAGMWRKKHAEEHAEHLRREAAKAERRAHERQLRDEHAQHAKEADERRRRRLLEKEDRRLDAAREAYERQWTNLLADKGTDGELGFNDVPWPIMPGSAEMTPEAILVFVVPEAKKKERRERLRETMLRFHPDKFEGRVMRRVREKERESVKEAVGAVARALNELMKDGG